MSESRAIELHVEMVGPMTGDMFIAALLDTFPDYEDAVLETIEATCERHPVNCRLAFRCAHDLRGHRFIMEPSTRDFGHLSVNQVEERESWSKLQAELASASLPGGVLRHANGILTLLARHQGTRQDLSLDAVTFPKKEAWIMLAQVVGAAVIIDALGTSRWTASLSGSHPAGAVGRGILAYMGALPEQAPPNAPRAERSILRSGVGFAGEPGKSAGGYVRVSCLDSREPGSKLQAIPTIPPAGAQQNGHGERGHD